MLTALVYSTATCPYCQMAKVYLKEKGVAFEEIDVSNNQAKAEEMIQKSGQMGVPVIELGGEIVVGFNKPEIDRILGLV